MSNIAKAEYDDCTEYEYEYCSRTGSRVLSRVRVHTILYSITSTTIITLKPQLVFTWQLFRELIPSDMLSFVRKRVNKNTHLTLIISGMYYK